MKKELRFGIIGTGFWAPVMALFLYNMTDANGNKAHLISSAAAFRNEPYANQTC